MLDCKANETSVIEVEVSGRQNRIKLDKSADFKTAATDLEIIGGECVLKVLVVRGEIDLKLLKIL